MEWLEHLTDLGLHQELHIHGDLAERAGEQSKERADLADAITHRVPGDLRLPEPEFLHQRGLHFEAVRAERRQCSGGARELADQHAWAQFLESLAMALERGEERRSLEAEGDRHRLLQVAASRHRCQTIAARQL